ncbi:MAG: hypothetical protein Kow0067_12590 [Coriobacteriia bacterium]
MATVLELRSAGKSFRAGRSAPIDALAQVSLAVEEGDFVVVTGRSGSGKTTLLNVMTGLTRPTAGTAYLGTTDIWELADARRTRLRNEHIGFVFQFPSLVPSLSLLENVILPSTFAGRARTAPRRDSDRARAVELLDLVGLGERSGARPAELSAGQQQRVVIARSLMNRPSVLVADEPTSNLDEATEAEIVSLFRRINDDEGVTVLMVTHGSDLVASGRRHIDMASGRIISDVRL